MKESGINTAIARRFIEHYKNGIASRVIKHFLSVNALQQRGQDLGGYRRCTEQLLSDVPEDICIGMAQHLFPSWDMIDYKGLCLEIQSNVSKLKGSELEKYKIWLLTPLQNTEDVEKLYALKPDKAAMREESCRDVYFLALFFAYNLVQYGKALRGVYDTNGFDFEGEARKYGVNVKLIEGRNELAFDVAEDFMAKQAGEPQQEAPELPKELNTERGRALLQKAIEAGFITVKAGQYKWNNTKRLCAYFASKATIDLALSTKTYESGTNTIKAACWKPFETLFKQTGLKNAFQSCKQENGGDFYLKDSYIIDDLFDVEQD